jgi:hypothetical protein
VLLRPFVRARQAVKRLTGFPLGGFGPAGAHPRARQLCACPGKALFEVADFLLQLVFRRDRVGGRCRGRRRAPFGIIEDLPAPSGRLGSFLGQPSPVLFSLELASLVLLGPALALPVLLGQPADFPVRGVSRRRAASGRAPVRLAAPAG